MEQFDTMIIERLDALKIIERIAKEIRDNPNKKFVDVDTSDIKGVLIRR